MIMKREIRPLFILYLVTYSTIASADASLVYQKHLQSGVEAFNKQQYREAARNFHEAHLIFPSERLPSQYLALLEKRDKVVSQVRERIRIVSTALERSAKKTQARSSNGISNADQVNRVRAIDHALRQSIKDSQVKPYLNEISALRATPSTNKDTSLVFSEKARGNADTLRLEDLANTSGQKISITLELGSKLIIEGRDIQKFLLTEDGFLQAELLDRDRIVLSAQKHGATFLHIWDTDGRKTIFLEVVLPGKTAAKLSAQVDAVGHAQPFRFSYASDGSSYYYGKKLSGMERRSINAVQQLGMQGETPYGVFDASGAMERGDSITSLPNYTVGLTNVPAPGTSNLNLRLFDSRRYLSPLTLSGTFLRGAFLDVNILDDALQLSLTHGKYEQSVGSISRAYDQSSDVTVEAGKVVLFPNNQDAQYALNYANAHGPGQQPDLTRYVYSIEGVQKLDEVTLNGELARDIRHNASTSGIKWERGAFSSAWNFRDINKDFTNVTVPPSYQGEIGATWTTDTDLDSFRVNTFADVYRDRLYFNPYDEQALNYDTRTHIRNPLGDEIWMDSNLHYVHTPGDISPRRNTGADSRLYRYFDLWNKRRATVFTGGSYQQSRYSNSPASEFNRYAVILGMQIPIWDGLSGYLNYEYSWVDELLSNTQYNPNVMNTGITYSKNITPKISSNWGIGYRNEANVKGSNSFLTGEDSINGSSGLMYTPNNDVNFFFDTRVRKVWPVVEGNSSYYDMDIRLGMRAAWGVPVYWDPSGTITGVVFMDNNGDGKRDPTEKGFYGVKVKAGTKEAITDRQGQYRIDIHAKNVNVYPSPETLPPGALFTTPPSSKVNIVNGSFTVRDFGVKINSGLYGVAFVDNNANHIPDSGDTYIGRVKLIVDDKIIKFTDSRGAYYFKDITPGKHWITIDINTLAEGLIPLIKIRTQIEVVEGTVYVFHIPMRTLKHAAGQLIETP